MTRTRRQCAKKLQRPATEALESRRLLSAQAIATLQTESTLVYGSASDGTPQLVHSARPLRLTLDPLLGHPVGRRNLLPIAIEITSKVAAVIEPAKFLEQFLRLVNFSFLNAGANTGRENLAASDKIEHAAGQRRDEALGGQARIVIDDLRG